MPFAFELVAYSVVFFIAILALYTVKDLLHEMRKDQTHAARRRSFKNRR